MYQVPLKIGSAFSGGSHKIERQDATDGLDVLVSSLERLRSLRRRELTMLSNLSTVVIDELDTFLDSGKE